MFKRRSRAALAVTLALMILGAGSIRCAPAARAETTPDYAQLWDDRKALMETQWAPITGPALTPWSGSAAATATWSDDMWHVTSVEQLAYVFSTLNPDETVDQSISISIDANLDFNGVTGGKKWDPPDFGGRQLRIEGNGHTLYNLKVETSTKRNSSFVMNIGDGSEIRNMTFKNVILSAPAGTMQMKYPDERGFVNPARNKAYDPYYARAAALFSDIYRDRIVFENIGMENALVSTTDYWAFAFIMTSKEQANTGDNFGGIQINNCYTRNVVCYAPGDPDGNIACTSAFIGGGAGGTDDRHGVTLNRCYSVESMVISGSGHSGGFSSCNSGKMTIQNCFSDVVVYGTRMTGAFQGVMHHGTYSFENCFALGSVEGQDYIGGFAATYQRQNYKDEYQLPCSVTFRNCYSGAITGMVGGGTMMGSFIGAAFFKANAPSLDFPGPQAYRFENCYAMGETGNIEIDVSASTGNPGAVGGFIGNDWSLSPTGTTFDYLQCYYDKQTTAMREWAIGIKKTMPGIQGVLTTDTRKSGRGLTGTAGIGGFTNFPESNPLEPVWYYEAGKYPELTAFRNASSADWSNPYLVRAYSKASVAAIHLDPWADLSGTYQGYDQTLVYDTVRDLTVGFDLSRDVSWQQIPNPHRTENSVTNPAKPTVSLYGESLPVLTLETVSGVTYARNPAPGIQWLSANTVVNGQKGQRRLRVIPTANLYTGKSAFILAGKSGAPYGQIYDHADDVFMAYSTGARMADDAGDITLGIYPDKGLTTRQKSVQGTTQDDPTIFAGLWDRYKEVSTKSVTGDGSSISVAGMRLAYYDAAAKVYKENVVGNTVPGGFGSVDNLNLDNAGSLNRWNDLFNGNTAFTNAELGLYALQYRWTLADGRHLEGGKLVSVLKGLSQVHIRVEDMDGTPVGDEVILEIVHGGGDPSLTGDTLQDLLRENIAYGTKTVAGWKHIADPAAIREIVIDMGRDHFGAAATRGTMTVKRRYYTNFYMERDRMFVTPVNVNKSYSLASTGTGTDIRTFLRLNQTPTVSEIPEFVFRDIEDDVYIRIRLRVREIYVNLRQIVQTPATVALPKFGYGKLNDIPDPSGLADLTQSRNVVFPTHKDTVAPPSQTYQRYRLPVKAFYRMTPILPQYYALERMVYDLSPTGTANETTAPSLALDYRTKDEYWVTVWLTSKLNPNPNNAVQVEANLFSEPVPAVPANP